jgi:hypothetical protein
MFLFDLSKTFLGLPEDEVDVNMERGLAEQSRGFVKPRHPSQPSTPISKYFLMNMRRV